MAAFFQKSDSRVSPILRAPTIVLAAVLAILGLTSCTHPAPSLEPGTGDAVRFSNPILDRDFPDPTVIQAVDGRYYAYATQTAASGSAFNIQVARSLDLVRWEHVGDALPDGPAWSTDAPSYWAPHVLYDQERQRYVMYYSAHHREHDAKCLAVAAADTPEGPFVDKGEPLLCGEAGFVNIDPMAFDDPVTGRRLLYWGSGFEPIKVQELAPDRMSFLPGTEPQPVVYPGQDSTYSRLIEGAWVTYRDEYYYLYYSGDNCCGEHAHYAVMVARSQSPFGSFERLGEANGTGDSVILEANDTWLAPGHNSILTDEQGQGWIFYHAIRRESPDSEGGSGNGGRSNGRVMLMDRVAYRDGWPYVEGGAPSADSLAGPETAGAAR